MLILGESGKAIQIVRQIVRRSLRASAQRGLRRYPKLRDELLRNDALAFRSVPQRLNATSLNAATSGISSFPSMPRMTS
jgi:hypothetical protein